MTQATIRQATIVDTCDIYKLVRRMFEEAPASMPTPDDRAALGWITLCVDDLCYVAEIDGELVGSIGMKKQSFPWSPAATFLSDTWFFVAPEYRNSAVASALLNKVKLAVVATGLPFIGGVIWGGDRVKLKDRMIKQHGFTYLGGNFTYGMDS